MRKPIIKKSELWKAIKLHCVKKQAIIGGMYDSSYFWSFIKGYRYRASSF
ncbi:MAG: hypothetical protein WDA47_03125 [Bacilli bacterium]